MLVKLLGVPDEYAFVDANDNSVPVRVLLVTVFESIAEVFLLCIAGYILSRAGVTDKATQRKLNVINVSLFTPALLFSKVAFSLTPSKLKEMWIIPIGFVVISGLSAAVAWVLSKMFKLKKSQTAFAVCAAMFQNSNSLPIALIQSLVVEVPGLKWDKDDTKDQMLGRALTYLVLYSTLGMMLRWSYGVKLLSQADDEVPSTDSYIPISDEPQANPMQVASPEPLERHPGARETDPFFTTTRNMTQDEQEDQRRQSRKISTERDLSPTASNWIPEPGSSTSHHQLNGPYRRSSSAAVNGSGRRGSSVERHNQRKKLSRADSGREFWGLPEAPKRQRIMLPEDVQEDSSSDSEDEEWGSSTPSSLRRRASQPPSTKFQSFTRRAGVKLRAFGKSVNAFMTVPMYAALLSIFIAMIPPLQAGLNKVKPLGQAIKGAGQCSIPVTLVVLGAFFYSPPDPNQANQLPTSNQDDAQKGGYFERKFRALAHRPKSNAYPGENKAVFVAVVSRMIIVPAIMLPFIALIARYDFFEAAEDPVFILAAVLLVSSPPALTLAQITQAASGDAFERLISKTITWSYAILTPPLTLAYVVIGLVFGRL